MGKAPERRQTEVRIHYCHHGIVTVVAHRYRGILIQILHHLTGPSSESKVGKVRVATTSRVVQGTLRAGRADLRSRISIIYSKLILHLTSFWRPLSPT